MIGLVMNATSRSLTSQQTTMPQTTATTEWKIRVLSSSRCSRKLIDGIRSSSAAGGSSVLVSGIVSVGCGAYIAGDRSAFHGRWRKFRRSCRNGPCGRRRRQDLALLFVLLLPLLILKLADFRLDLRLELVRGALELIQGFPDLAGNHRQLLGPEQKQRQDEQNHRIGKTHSLIIAKVLVSGNAEGQVDCQNLATESIA